MSLATVRQIEQPADCGWEIDALSDELQNAFGVRFAFWLGEDHGLSIRPDDIPLMVDGGLEELVSRAAQRSEPQFVADEDVVALLAIPFSFNEKVVVAVGPLAISTPTAPDDFRRAASLLGTDQAGSRRWFTGQPIWPTEVALRMAATFQKSICSERTVDKLRLEIDKVSDNLAATYEEISLLYGVTQNLRLSSSDEDLGRLVIDWLLECLPAEGIALQYLPLSEDGRDTYEARTESLLLTSGKCPVENAEFCRLVESLNLEAGASPFVANEIITSADDWPVRAVRQLIMTPLAEGDNIFGWMAVVNHIDGDEFGTVEASLLSSVSTILGVHSGNHELYRQQAEFLARVVHALTSAIDAKDPYTCGHSDRVARVSVRLARELDIDEPTVNTLYMAGLLHDIGKIGIDDNVLRKPGRLTDAEYEHIKMHPELGYRILKDIRQFAGVLPVVLHHHEQWDGNGYPCGLAEDEIPLLARIAAVADAYDAMSSDRPYRKGMPLEKVETIFREGAGKQWDAKVVDAFFAALDDIRDISQRERANLSLDVQQWT